MKNTEKYPEIDIFSLEKDIAEIAPLFDDIAESEKMGSPSENVINTIHAEAARSQLRRKFEHKLRRVMRVAAAAAVLVLILDGGLRINEHQENNRRKKLLNQLRIVSSEDGALPEDKTISDSSTEDIAEMLMEMQGFDEDSYFAVN